MMDYTTNNTDTNNTGTETETEADATRQVAIASGQNFRWLSADNGKPCQRPQVVKALEDVGFEGGDIAPKPSHRITVFRRIMQERIRRGTADSKDTFICRVVDPTGRGRIGPTIPSVCIRVRTEGIATLDDAGAEVYLQYGLEDDEKGKPWFKVPVSHGSQVFRSIDETYCSSETGMVQDILRAVQEDGSAKTVSEELHERREEIEPQQMVDFLVVTAKTMLGGFKMAGDCVQLPAAMIKEFDAMAKVALDLAGVEADDIIGKTKREITKQQQELLAEFKERCTPPKDLVEREKWKYPASAWFKRVREKFGYMEQVNSTWESELGSTLDAARARQSEVSAFLEMAEMLAQSQKDAEGQS